MSMSRLGRLRRADDTKVVIPRTWQACESDTECRLVRYGCTITASSVYYLPDTANKAQIYGGDPSVVSCASAMPSLQLPLCVLGRCGAFAINVR
jgi:hypothetical protein